MRNPKSIAALLGITQEDLSLLFGGHRSRFSRYGSGFSKLPLWALNLIDGVVRFLFDPETDKHSKAVEHQLSVQQAAIEDMIAENEAAIARIKLQLPTVKAKNQYYLNGMKSLEFLSASELAADEENAAILRSIRFKTSQGLQSFGSDTIFRLEHRLELLELQKLLLEAELLKIRRARENTEGI